MKNVTVAQFAASLMNAIATNPSIGNLELNVEIEPGQTYANITGVESSYQFKMNKDGSFTKTDRLSIKLG